MLQSGLQGKPCYVWYTAGVVLSDCNKNWSSEKVTFDIDDNGNEFKKQRPRRVVSASSEETEEKYTSKAYPQGTANDGVGAPWNIENVNSATPFFSDMWMIQPV